MDEPITFEAVAQLLSEGLDLCVRAKKLDGQVSEANIKSHFPGYGGDDMVCLTPALWIMDQYDRDLASWEAKARAALCNLPAFELGRPTEVEHA